jgi:molecular chaperone GrpE (heat shock protein)
VDAASAETRPEQDSSVKLRPDADPLPELIATLADLKDAFDSKIRYDEVKERQISALHKELESHRQGLYQQILRPVFMDLIAIYDEADNHAGIESATAGGGGSLREMVEVVLERYGVTKYVCEGRGLDRSRQKVISIERTSDPDLDRRLARRLRPGFDADGKVLRPEWVVAYRYEADGELDG